MLAIHYDNVSGNTGDSAIGISLNRILTKWRVPFEEFNPSKDYKTVIVGGGLLLGHSIHRKFRLAGPHILNCVGIFGSPKDLHYLKDYNYISVRSHGDKAKLSYLEEELYNGVNVVPCTTMLLEDEYSFNVEADSVGVHLVKGAVKDEKAFCDWANNTGLRFYFIPITFYNYNEVEYLSGLSKNIRNSSVMPAMNPLQIFSFIGKMKFMISCSLHGGIFAYVHNVPFLLYDKLNYNGDEKMRFFMEDRGLESDLFYSVDDIKDKFGAKRDYSDSLKNDQKTLDEHLYTIKCLI